MTQDEEIKNTLARVVSICTVHLSDGTQTITVPGEAGDLHEGETLSIPEGAKYIRITSVTDTSRLGSGQQPYVTVHY